MARRPRLQGEAGIYHVMSRGNGKQLIFDDANDKLRFCDLLGKKSIEHEVEILAWCLMDNHFHLLLKASSPSLSAFMKALCLSYARYFNKKHDRVGHLFQGRFKSEPIEGDRHFLTALRYVHQNPVAAGLCRSCSYPWSSYDEYVSGEGIAETDFALGLFSGLEDFRIFHDETEKSRFADVGDGAALDAEEARELANRILEGKIDCAKIASLSKPSRNEALRKLKEGGLTVRQIQRLTGVGRNIVQRA